MAMTAPTGTVRFARWLDTRLLYIEERDAAEYFDHIQDVRITKDARPARPRQAHRGNQSGHFEPAKFKDHYASSLQELLEKKQKRQPIAASKKAPPSNVYNQRALAGADGSLPRTSRTRAAPSCRDLSCFGCLMTRSPVTSCYSSRFTVCRASGLAIGRS